MPKSECVDIAVACDHTDSDLGRFTTCSWTPPSGHALDGIVERIWYFAGVMTHRRERGFPNGLVEIIVQLDEPHRPVEPDPGPPFPAVCVTGLQQRSFLIEAPPGACRVLGVRLNPAAAWMVLRSEPGELIDRTVDLRDLIGRTAGELGERCSSACDGGACVQVAADWILRRTFAHDRPDARVARAVRRLRGDAPCSIAGLISDAGLSASRFTQIFRDHLGVSPKRYGRIARFTRTLDALNRGDALAGIAADYGYFDQSHLSAEFRQHAGVSPTEYLSAVRYEGGSLAESEPAIAVFS